MKRAHAYFLFKMLAVSLLFFRLSWFHAYAQGTSFTYQGRLNDGTNPASGNYDLRFTILDANAGGNIFGVPITNSINIPSNGIFTVTLDFGANVFNGASRWLEIAVRTNGGGAFDTLFNRQAITPTPYSVQATTAGNLTGVVVASGAGFTNLTGANVLGAVSDALHATSATNAPDGKPLVSNAGVTNIVTLINSNNVLNVKDFGAYGDNLHDDWQAIQNAINARPAANVFFPPGNYRISKPLNIISNGVTLAGSGTAGSSYGIAATILTFTNVGNGFNFPIPDTHFCTIKSMTIFGPGTETSTGAAVCMSNGLGSCIGNKFENLNIERFNTGFNLNGLAICSWENVNVQDCIYGIYNVDTYTPFSLVWTGGSITDCKNVFSKAFWTFTSLDMGNQPTGNFMVITNGTRMVFLNCNMEQNVSLNSSPMIFADTATIELIGGKFGGMNGPVFAVSNAVNLTMIGAALSSSTIAPIWSYSPDEHITDEGTFHPPITNILFSSLYNAPPLGMGHTFSATLRIQALSNPSLRFGMFIDEFADFRGSALFFVGKMFGAWQPMDLLEYYKDKRNGVFPILNANQTFTGTNIFNSRVGINTNNPGATLDVNGSLRVGHGTTIFSNLQAGLAQMTDGATTTRTNFTFTFPKAFVSAPNVLVSAHSETNVDDTFAVTVRVATTTNCTVNIARSGTTGGWTQHVKITWMAWE